MSISDATKIPGSAEMPVIVMVKPSARSQLWDVMQVVPMTRSRATYIDPERIRRAAEASRMCPWLPSPVSSLDRRNAQNLTTSSGQPIYRERPWIDCLDLENVVRGVTARGRPAFDQSRTIARLLSLHSFSKLASAFSGLSFGEIQAEPTS